MGLATGYQHIMLDDAGVPMIAGTKMKVVELIVDHKANGWSPQELQFQHPYLSLGQIHSALAYYWDHQDELQPEVERRLQRLHELQRSLKPSYSVSKRARHSH